MTIVVAGLIEEGGRVLAGQRRADQEHPLKWEFPGGKVEAGELPSAALARELWEELRIEAAIGKEIVRYEYAYPAKPPIQIVFFEVSRFFGTPQNLIFTRLEWIPRGDLDALDFLDGDLAFVKLLNGSERV